MTFEQFKVLVKGLKSVYTSEKFMPDADAITIWYRLLKDLSYPLLEAAIQKYMLTNSYPPTIADLRALAAEIREGEKADWGDGWEQVLRAIREHGLYDAQNALEGMDAITRRCVQRLGFTELCTSDNIAADRANFRMLYETEVKRQKERDQLPADFRNKILQITVKQIGGTNHDDV